MTYQNEFTAIWTIQIESVFMSWGYQSASYWLSDNFGLPGGRFCPFWQPGAARVYLICSQTAWGCQGAHNWLCDSLGWQGGDFAFPASFLILNEIMCPGWATLTPGGKLTRDLYAASTPWLAGDTSIQQRWYIYNALTTLLPELILTLFRKQNSENRWSIYYTFLARILIHS